MEHRRVPPAGSRYHKPAASCHEEVLPATTVRKCPFRRLRWGRAAIRPQGISRALETYWAEDDDQGPDETHRQCRAIAPVGL